MADAEYVPVFNWPIAELTLSERSKSLAPLWAHIAPLVQPGQRALDICCGSGAAAFMLEETGAAVTAIDSSPLLLGEARTEAARRSSAVEFVQADVLHYRFDTAGWELALVLGNPIIDFPPERFGGWRDAVASALKQDSRLVVEFRDCVEFMRNLAEPVDQLSEREPEEVTSHFKGYDARHGRFTVEFHNHTRNERCTYYGYIYTLPVLRQLLAPSFTLQESHPFSDGHCLEIYTRR